eukprot:XP_019918242.1 PREDICTED: uncharacterized protein LOC105349148 isoform X2 [Crassostrea gigas]
MPSSPKSASTSSSTFESTCSTLDFSLKATAPSTEEVAEQAVESACTSEPNIASEGDKTTSHVQIKRRKISFEQLQKMQYEVLCCQKKNIELQNMKLRKDLERADLEKQNMELQNSKLALQIECLKQTVTQNENALLALQAITDE